MKRPNGGGSLYKEQAPGRSPRWVSEAYVTLPDGRRKRVRGRGLTPEQATIERVKRALALEQENPASERLTVRQLTERWVDARSHSWKASTLASYRTTLDLHVLPELGSARVSRVTALDAQRVVNRVLRESEGRHVAAANRARRTMHAFFAYAVEVGLVRVNPVDGVRAVRAPERERGWWTRGQAVAFLTVARGPYRDLFHAAVETGLRSGELLALRWRDVTPEGVTVRRTFSRHARGRIQEAPKSASSRRTVPLGGTLRARLEARRGDPDALVFPSRTGGVLNPSNVNRALRRFALAAGVPVLRFHDLRRTYASLLAEEGYHPSVIQRLLGHATVDLALRVYTSVTEASLAGAAVDVWGNGGGNRGNLPGSEDATMGRRPAKEVAPDTLN